MAGWLTFEWVGVISDDWHDGDGDDDDDNKWKGIMRISPESVTVTEWPAERQTEQQFIQHCVISTLCTAQLQICDFLSITCKRCCHTLCPIVA